MVLPEVHAQTASIKAMCSAQIESMEAVKKSIYGFILEPGLRGMTYDSAKNYFKDAYIPLANGLILLSEAIMKANEAFPEKYVAEVDTNSLYTDVLEQQIQRLNFLAQSLENLQIANPLIDSTTQAMARNLRQLQLEIQRKLEKLMTFNHTSVQVFSEIEAIYADVQKGLREVSSGKAWNAGTGTFLTSRLDLSWVSAINERIKSSELFEKIARANKSSDAIFKEHLHNQFGFEDEEIELMLKLRDQLEEIFPRAKQDELDWRFTRLLGGFSYGGPNETSGDEFQWNHTASNPYYGMSEAQFFTKILGFSKEEYNLLRYKVRIQNQIVSSPEKLNWDNFERNDRLFEKYKEGIESAIGRKLTKEEFKTTWIEQYNNMLTKGDFAHQQITTATIINNKWVLTDWIYGKEKKEELAGWLGDATLGDSPSFGNDDYMADLDAANIYYLMQEKTLSYQEGWNKYYEEIEIDYTRADMFKMHTDIEHVKESIFDELNVISMEELKLKAPESYRFIRSLEENGHEMGAYK